jgi:hypothetical protein
MTLTHGRNRISRENNSLHTLLVWLLAMVAGLFLVPSAAAQTFTELYPFWLRGGFQARHHRYRDCAAQLRRRSRWVKPNRKSCSG